MGFKHTTSCFPGRCSTTVLWENFRWFIKRERVHWLLRAWWDNDWVSKVSPPSGFFGWNFIYDAPSVVVMRMRWYYALQKIFGQARGFSSRPAIILLLFKKVDRQNTPSVRSPHDRSARLFQQRLIDGERERARQRWATHYHSVATFFLKFHCNIHTDNTIITSCYSLKHFTCRYLAIWQ